MDGAPARALVGKLLMFLLSRLGFPPAVLIIEPSCRQFHRSTIMQMRKVTNRLDSLARTFSADVSLRSWNAPRWREASSLNRG
ncbi:hypothetical protein M514_06091 [Trichuris suis]|uniref:Uncharacterized protein n=1 Tax=Trichuris suis TaxID=68888 RepID=A0A085M6X9_9BILA|nr:hypothetical protein M513_06091 [Trichuris suis]KFD69895.1 hypothetical protein M514_06091 [Trichuris suis]